MGAPPGVWVLLQVPWARTHLGTRREAEGKGDTYEQDGEARGRVRAAHMEPNTSRSVGDRPRVILRARVAAVLFRPAWRVPPVLSSEARSKAQGRAARSRGRGGQAEARPGTHEIPSALTPQPSRLSPHASALWLCFFWGFGVLGFWALESRKPLIAAPTPPEKSLVSR